MASWSSLAPEVKQHVIKKLDFMSRHSLRCTSRLDREIVDSTICKLPLVRFGFKEDKCLIVIYTGIEKFLRWELTKYEDGFKYDRFDNTLDPKQANKKLFSNEEPVNKNLPHFYLAIDLLYSLIGFKSVKIETLECDVSKMGVTDEEHVKARNVHGDIVDYIIMTKCGTTVHTFHSSFESEFLETFDIKKCGIGSLCKNCTDPFDYWYTQNLSSRIYYEPFWNRMLGSEIVQRRGGNDVGMKELSEKFKKQEKEKMRKEKIEVMKKGRVEMENKVVSWGFKPREMYGPIEMDYEPLVKESTVIKSQGVLQKIRQSVIKDLTVFLILPISISIVFYVFFMDVKFNFEFFQ